MTDIIERAERLLTDAEWCRACKVEQPPFPRTLLTELVAELKSVRAEAEALRAHWENYG